MHRPVRQIERKIGTIDGIGDSMLLFTVTEVCEAGKSRNVMNKIVKSQNVVRAVKKFLFI